MFPRNHLLLLVLFLPSSLNVFALGGRMRRTPLILAGVPVFINVGRP